MIPIISLIGLTGVPEIRFGDNLSQIFYEASIKQDTPFKDNDILVVTQKAVSKAEGQLIDLDKITPSSFAKKFANQFNKNPKIVEVVLRETKRIVRMSHGLIISETHHGFICANAGVDKSNIPGNNFVTTLPKDPDKSAKNLLFNLQKLTGLFLPIIISDTFGRPWREGIVNVAIGIAGLEPLIDYRGELDTFGNVLQTTILAVADEIASAAELITGKTEGIPAVILRGYKFKKTTSTQNLSKKLLRSPSLDLFR